MPPTPDIIDNLKYIVEFLSAAIFTAGTSFELFTAALVSRRPLRAFVHTLTAPTRTDPSLHAVSPFLGILLHLLAISPSHGIARTLREGLLPVVFACGTRHMSTTHNFLIQFFKNILAPATVFHSVLYQLRIALSTLDNSQTAPMLALHEFAVIWDIIGRILSVQLQMIAPIQLRQCLHISTRWTGIPSVVRAVPSRTTAHQPVSASTGKEDTEPFANRSVCAIKIVANKQMIGNSGQDVPCIAFDFWNGVVKIQILPLRTVCPGLDTDATRRVVNAQYHLLIMRFVDGKEDHALVYPVLSASAL
ncbi:hypothetical protein B0H14DRAFT_3488864 [Mycena olivaceomarginata]|nr:hypothetical protein B0H14DRAFT_3488864 [Mycena olivaceomarginata]